MKRATLVLATSVALFLSGASVVAATRVPTSEPSLASVMGAAQGAIGLPYGDPAYFGPEFTATHTAGSRFQPGSTLGQVMPGAAPKVKVPIRPVVTINPLKLAKSAVSSIKGGGVPGIVASAAVMWAIEQIPGAEIKEGEPVRSPQPQTSTGVYWETSRDQVKAIARFAGSTEACQSLTTAYPHWYYGPVAGTFYPCYGSYQQNVSGARQGWVQRVAYNCPYGVGENFTCNTSPSPTGPAQPFTDSDYLSLEDALSRVTNSDWLRDLTRAKCQGSLSPEACYQDLVARRPNHGPSTQTTPASTSTSTTQNPDGTTSTTTTKTQNKYDYTYTHNSFDYTVTTTSSVTKDGQTTTTTTTEPPLEDGQEPQEEPKEEEEMPEISDAYKPYIDKLNDIKTDVSVAPSVVTPLGWSAWYSFGGGCSEINVELPVIGSWSTGYCPYMYDWVRPILGFLFVVFTWHYCRELWSEAVVQARPM